MASKLNHALPLAEEQAGARSPLPDRTPRTALGRRLWRLRRRIVASGEGLLTWREVQEEVRKRRGEREHCR